MEKICTKCLLPKDLEEFGLHVNGKHGRRSICDRCAAKHRRARYAQDPKSERARAAAWRQSNPEKMKTIRLSSDLQKRYDMTVEDYDQMLAGQDGKCAICRKPPSTERLAVDHDHVTGRVRGLVHRKCNSILGFAAEDPTLLRGAALYLEAHRA